MKQVQATKMEGWTSSAKQKLPQSSYRGSQASRLKKLEDFEYNRISHHKTCALWRSWWFTNIRIGVALPCRAMPCRFLAKYWWTMMNQENGLLNLADLHSEYQTDVYYSSTFWDPCELVSHHGKRMADTQKKCNECWWPRQTVHAFRNSSTWKVGLQEWQLVMGCWGYSAKITLKLGFVNVYLPPGQLT